MEEREREKQTISKSPKRIPHRIRTFGIINPRSNPLLDTRIIQISIIILRRKGCASRLSDIVCVVIRRVELPVVAVYAVAGLIGGVALRDFTVGRGAL